MATRKKKGKSRKKRTAAKAAAQAEAQHSDELGEDYEEEASEDGERPSGEVHRSVANGDESEDTGSALTPAMRPKDVGSGRPKFNDDLIPSPDGQRVSSSGGLVFVGVVFGLIVVAIVVQYFIGQ